jgi:hypothetical protein
MDMVFRFARPKRRQFAIVFDDTRRRPCPLDTTEWKIVTNDSSVNASLARFVEWCRRDVDEWGRRDELESASSPV